MNNFRDVYIKTDLKTWGRHKVSNIGFSTKNDKGKTQRDLKQTMNPASTQQHKTVSQSQFSADDYYKPSKQQIFISAKPTVVLFDSFPWSGYHGVRLIVKGVTFWKHYRSYEDLM